ncbi:galactosylceramide sulfotransferase-like [Ptychodera flava]|uniref:galactosylceramide sulfotransferase-like n=1 Tax=Ptychodera flava TaxID=63121 RepID=UPI00396A3B81
MDITSKKAFLCIIFISFFVMASYFAMFNDHSLSSSTKHKPSFRWFASDVLKNALRLHRQGGILCTKITQIVYIKTHKTASSTTNSVIQRFGYNRRLAFALPKKGHIFNEKQLFTRKLLQYKRPPSNQSNHFNIIASHLIYNRPELDKVVPDATYITIIRSPVQRFESAFGYYNYASKVGLQASENALEKFMKEPDKYANRMEGVSRGRLRNGMSFNLGFDHRFDDNDSAIDEMINKLDKELDLVLISDYFEESLVLLKNVLCWKLDDILYISKGIRSKNKRYTISKSVAERILKWNKADVKLYEHFNRTFWKKINSYGADFYKDLREYRTSLRKFQEECAERNKTKLINNHVDGLVMKTNASSQCKSAFIGTAAFHVILKREAKEFHDMKDANIAKKHR